MAAVTALLVGIRADASPYRQECTCYDKRSKLMSPIYLGRNEDREASWLMYLLSTYACGGERILEVGSFLIAYFLGNLL